MVNEPASRDLIPSMSSPTEAADTPFPRSAGTYALILKLSAGRRIQVGKLGAFDFPAGHFLYVGSAFGPGGLAGRLGHHLSPVKPDSRLHWHVDYLRPWAPVVEIWFAEHTEPREHEWAAIAGRLSGNYLPAPRFGASDCRCRSHLFHFEAMPSAVRFQAALELVFPADWPLRTMPMSQRNNR